ncbi:Uncharacterised protein [Mycobacteroides abscessus subsp. abscessus]|nr:Uncharacterised protein [Mycobacteroides abscessus subsp. abscessus]
MEPISPSSSAPQNANRTAFFTSGLGPSCSAVSSTAAVPVPLSLIPGPSGTLSRCAPAMTTSVVAPVLVCAITLRALTSLVSASTLRTTLSGWALRSAPTDFVTLTTGILGLESSPRVPLVLFSSTLSAMITAAAPRSAATLSLSANGHDPRSTSTTAPLTSSPS